jgi:alpha-tubulin suppressor-like RCC1 family protein
MLSLSVYSHSKNVIGLFLAAFSIGSLSQTVEARPVIAANVALAFGSNASGQLGIGTNASHSPIAVPIDTSNLAGRRIIDASTGGSHSLLLTNDGTAYSFGSNIYGQTGLGAIVPPLPQNTLVATEIDGTNMNGSRAIQVAAGGLHSLVLSTDGTVLSFGRNSFGQLGIGTGDLNIATPIDSSNLGDSKVTQIAAGALHSLILTEDGSVFSFGSNNSGELGRAGSRFVAAQIDGTNLTGRKITQVTAGASYSLLLADDGTVFSFGWNSGGRTGQGTTSSTTPIATQIDVSNLGDKKIVELAAGEAHSLLLADDGTVFSFGENFFGKTGISSSLPFPSSTPVATPINTTNLAGKRIVDLGAGENHSLLLADDGSIFSFGSNSIGQLGIDNFTAPRYIATPIDTTHLMGRRVTSISAGYEHNLVLAVPECESALLLAHFGIAIAGRFVGRRR